MKKKLLLSMSTVLTAASMVLTPVTTTFAAEPDNTVTEITTEDTADTVDNTITSDDTVVDSVDLPAISDEESGIEPAWIFEKTYKVTGNNVNIRTGAGTKYSIVGTLYKGDIISVKSIDNGWAKFKYNGQWRYVSSTYIKAA